MLRKTAAIAVLILMISSLFSGSLGRVQADAPAKIDGAYYERALQWSPPIALGAGRPDLPAVPGAFGFAVGAGTAGKEVMAIPAAGAGFVVSSGVVPVEFKGNDSGESGLQYATMVIWMNDSMVEIAGAEWADFMEERAKSGVMFKPSLPPRGKMAIHGKVQMFKPGSLSPDTYDLKWERKHVDVANVFSAHMMIPAANASAGMAYPPWPDAGWIELFSDITVDLANMTLVEAGGLQYSKPDSQYDNEISAGQSKWHKADISGAVESLNVDLKWQNPDSDLKLVIYTPDGHVLGPFDDSSDGKDDGRVNLNVDNPSGVASGEWHLKVSDEDAAGKDEYYVRTY